ncbi:hypothetical protein [Sphingomonas montana]|uniref:hypothetical protein n=1 Tax=Sphingomonas montana TaxID=1843236 RepID=UPI00096D14E5|nr:hypothetical protein [Sphingomonas montana]
MTGRVRFGLLAALVLATSLWGAAMVRRLNAVRMREAAMLAVVRTPLPPRSGADPVARVRADVAGSGVAIVRLAAGGRQGGVRRALVTLAGPEPAMRDVLARLERGRPAIRFAEWRLVPEAGAADRLRFEGVALAWSDDDGGGQ